LQGYAKEDAVSFMIFCIQHWRNNTNLHAYDDRIKIYWDLYS
jgi:hypothetical protein